MPNKKVEFFGNLEGGRQALLITQEPKRQEPKQDAEQIELLDKSTNKPVEYNRDIFLSQVASVASTLERGVPFSMDDIRARLPKEPAVKNWLGIAAAARLKRIGARWHGAHRSTSAARKSGLNSLWIF